MLSARLLSAKYSLLMASTSLVCITASQLAGGWRLLLGVVAAVVVGLQGGLRLVDAVADMAEACGATPADDVECQLTLGCWSVSLRHVVTAA